MHRPCAFLPVPVLDLDVTFCIGPNRWNWRSVILSLLSVLVVASHVNSANATVGYPDLVLDFYDSGAGPFAEPYGGSYPDGLGWPVPVPLGVVIGDDPGPTGFNDFLSLPIDSFVALGFADERIVDGPGNDIQIMVPYGPGETAEVFVRANGGEFEFLGVAKQPDFADCDDPAVIVCLAEGRLDLSAIDFSEPVDSIKIVSQSTLGSSPGFDFFHVTIPPGSIHVVGDLDSDRMLSDVDIDLLAVAILSGLSDTIYDLNIDRSVDQLDRDFWVRELANTYLGDANLDGEFNGGDLVTVFRAGQYEDATIGNSGWATGDWNGDAEFDTSDLVLAFQDGGYEQGPRSNSVAIPEPSAAWLLLSGLLLLATRCPTDAMN